MIGGDLLRENLADTDPPLQNADFQSTFAHSASAVTASEKSSIDTNRKSTTRFPLSLRWIVYVDPKPQRGLSSLKRKASKI